MGFKLHYSVNKLYLWIPGVLVISLLVFLLWSNSSSTISIALGGDVMLARDSLPVITESAAFGNALSVLKEADLAAANLESPLAYSMPGSSNFAGYNLCALSSSAMVLRDAGFDVLSIQNNHTFDCNPTGDLETQKWLAEVGIKALGSELTLINVEKEKIAFLAYEGVTQPFDLNRMLIDIASARNAADVLIVSLHWGNEYQAGPDDRSDGNCPKAGGCRSRCDLGSSSACVTAHRMGEKYASPPPHFGDLQPREPDFGSTDADGHTKDSDHYPEGAQRRDCCVYP